MKEVLEVLGIKKTDFFSDLHHFLAFIKLLLLSIFGSFTKSSKVTISNNKKLFAHTKVNNVLLFITCPTYPLKNLLIKV